MTHWEGNIVRSTITHTYARHKGCNNQFCYGEIVINSLIRAYLLLKAININRDVSIYLFLLK